MTRFAVLVVGLFSGVVLSAQSANADMRVCNRTSYVLYAAVGYESGLQMLTRGWTRMAPGDCTIALQGTLNQTSYFLYARSSRAHAGPMRAWGGRIRLCAKETNFAIDVPVGTIHCGSDDAFLVPFASIATGHKASWSATLTETRRFATAAAARAAGVTRLLSDVGYPLDVNADLPATARWLSDFRARLRLPANASDADLFEALETEALKGAAPAGYTVCNDGQAEIWAAIGLRSAHGNLARGWWDVPPGACAKILTAPLNAAAVYLHATRFGNPDFVSGPATFCVGREAFETSAATRCTGQGRSMIGFAETGTKGRAGFVAHIGSVGLLPPPPKLVKPAAANGLRKDQKAATTAIPHAPSDGQKSGRNAPLGSLPH